MACQHPKEPGLTRCAACSAAYFREYRKVALAVAVRAARRKGAIEFRETMARRFEELAEIFEFNGRTAASMVREMTLGD